jgi:hypothetical protein
MLDRTHVVKSLQYLVGAVAFLWVATQANWSLVGSVVRSADLLVLFAVASLSLGEFGGRFFVWNLLLNRVEDTPLRSAANVDLVIMFINHLLPSRLSGRAVAPLVIRHYTDLEWSEAVALAGVHTGIHAVLYGVAAGIGVLALSGSLALGLLVVIVLSTGLYLGAGTAIIAAGHRIDAVDGLIAWLQPHVARLPYVGERIAGLFEKAPEFTGDSATVFRTVTADPTLWGLYGFGWAWKIMLFPAIRVWLLLGVFGVQFSDPFLLPFVLVAAYSVTLLPITPGGVGVAEATATIVFVALGVPEGVAGPVVILDRFFGVYVAALAGWPSVMRVDLHDVLAREG